MCVSPAGRAFHTLCMLGLLGYCTPANVLWSLRFIDDVFGILLNM